MAPSSFKRLVEYLFRLFSHKKYPPAEVFMLPFQKKLSRNSKPRNFQFLRIFVKDHSVSFPWNV
jgi:hypothetical protein